MNGGFMDKVSAALLCRSRCGSDSVNFGCYDQWDEAMLNRWLYHVFNRCTQELHLDLPLQRIDFRDHLVVKEPCNDVDADADVPPDDKCPTSSQYHADYCSHPRRLFTCLGIRTLCLGACSLEPPAELIDLPFLETLCLSTIRSTGNNNIQRLISGCPRLVDLTLERCGYTGRHYIDPLPDKIFTITVLDKRLRRFALRCCHNLVSASIDASELTTLDHRGDVPSESILTLHGGAHKIASCTIAFCGKKVHKEFPRFRNFLERFTDTKQLRLLSTHLGSQIQSKFFVGFPCFTSLVRLELTGHVGGRSVDAVTRILEQAPCLEILSLFMKPLEEGRFRNVWRVHELVDEPTVPDVSIPCLRNRVREINLVHYQGHQAQRYVAKLLLCNAMVLEPLCAVFPSDLRELQVRLKTQIEGWVVNTSTTEMIFL